MLSTILICYVVLAELTVLGIFLSSILCGSLEQVDTEGVATKKLVVLAVVMGIVSAPVIFPYFVYQMFFGSIARECREEVAELQKQARTWRPLLLDPMHRYNIDDMAWNYYEEESPLLVAKNYQQLGEFWLKGDPLKIIGRLFLEHNGHSIVELSVIDGQPFVEAISYLEDGSVINSANCPPPGVNPLLDQNGFYVQADPTLELESLLVQHQQFLKMHSESTGHSVCAIPEDDWKTYYRYHNRRYGAILLADGKFDNGPEGEVVFPKLSESQNQRPMLETNTSAPTV